MIGPSSDMLFAILEDDLFKKLFDSDFLEFAYQKLQELSNIKSVQQFDTIQSSFFWQLSNIEQYARLKLKQKRNFISFQNYNLFILGFNNIRMKIKSKFSLKPILGI